MIDYAFVAVKFRLTNRLFNLNASEADKIQDEMAWFVG